jgi:hypothetical protein
MAGLALFGKFPSVQPILVVLYLTAAYVCFEFRKWTLPLYLLASIPGIVVIEVPLYLLFVPPSVGSVIFLVANIAFLPMIQVLFIAYQYRDAYGQKTPSSKFSHLLTP